MVKMMQSMRREWRMILIIQRLKGRKLMTVKSVKTWISHNLVHLN